MKNIELIDKAIDDLIKWPSNAPFEDHLYQLSSGKFIAGIAGGTTPAPFCTFSEFVARKAERQNKPDWNDVLQKHPEAQYLAQWSGCDGENKGLWISYDTKPDCESGYVVKVESSIYHHSAGQIIGQWQDTLEQRPAVTEAPELNVAGDDWHARGELPPMGTECEYTIGDNFCGFKPCHFVGLNSRGSLVVEGADGMLKQFHKHQINLRPLRTEREKFIEAALAVNPWMFSKKMTDALGELYDAGFRQPDQK